MNSNKLWGIIYIILGSIAAIILGIVMIEYGKTRTIDCEKLEKKDMIPKQCEKGEQNE